MKNLSEADRLVLQEMSRGLSDFELCQKLEIEAGELRDAVARITARAEVESEDAGRYYERALRRRAERQNESLHARFSALMDILPHAVFVVDGRSGVIKEFNDRACEVFGYTREQMTGLPVEELVSESKRSIHHAYRIGFLASVRKREMGYHPPIFGVRRDGAKIEMAIALTATTADDDVMVVCSDFSVWENSKELEDLRSEHEA